MAYTAFTTIALCSAGLSAAVAINLCISRGKSDLTLLCFRYLLFVSAAPGVFSILAIGSNTIGLLPWWIFVIVAVGLVGFFVVLSHYYATRLLPLGESIFTRLFLELTQAIPILTLLILGGSLFYLYEYPQMSLVFALGELLVWGAFGFLILVLNLFFGDKRE